MEVRSVRVPGRQRFEVGSAVCATSWSWFFQDDDENVNRKWRRAADGWVEAASFARRLLVVLAQSKATKNPNMNSNSNNEFDPVHKAPADVKSVAV